MMYTDEYFMKEALKEANKARIKDEVPIGCVLVCDNKIIARGHNLKEKNQLVISHAEINVINKANKKLKSWRLTDCTLYVTLEPCPMCASAIQQARIKRVVFGASDKKGGALGGLFDLFFIPNLNHYPLVSQGILEEECRNILKDYFRSKRKKND